MFSQKFVASVLLAVTYASSALAAPYVASTKHETHRVRDISPEIQLSTYHPESSYEVRLHLSLANF